MTTFSPRAASAATSSTTGSSEPPAAIAFPPYFSTIVTQKASSGRPAASCRRRTAVQAELAGKDVAHFACLYDNQTVGGAPGGEGRLRSGLSGFDSRHLHSRHRGSPIAGGGPSVVSAGVL